MVGMQLLKLETVFLVLQVPGDTLGLFEFCFQVDTSLEASQQPPPRPHLRLSSRAQIMTASARSSNGRLVCRVSDGANPAACLQALSTLVILSCETMRVFGTCVVSISE
jgi:hypothetical protein